MLAATELLEQHKKFTPPLGHLQDKTYRYHQTIASNPIRQSTTKGRQRTSTEGGQYATTEGERSHTSEGGHRHDIIWQPDGSKGPQDDTPHQPRTYKTEHPNARYHGGGRASPRDQKSDDTQQPTARRREQTPFSPRHPQIRPPTNTITYLHLPFDLPKIKTSSCANLPRQGGAKTSIQNSNKPKTFPQNY